MVCTQSVVSAQNVGKLAGHVRDAATNEPLIGCNVLILWTKLGASTDLQGEYFVLNIPPGKYEVQASLIGYQTVIQREVIVHAGRTTTADFHLTPTTLEQDEVIVQAVRPDVEREKTSTSAIIRSEDVQMIAGVQNVGDILFLAADVTDGHFRGGRLNEEYYTLQGLGIINPLDNSTAFLPIMGAVEEVEVITSGFSAQYGNAQSGVVNITMKEGRSDKWVSQALTRVRAPGRKHFGPSVFDPNANRYLALLLDEAFWRGLDSTAGSQIPYYGRMGSGLTGQYARDTAVQVAVARTLWMQTRRDLYRSYGTEVDHSIEASAGGPLSVGLRMFVALQSNLVWPVFPTEEPNIQRQVLGNIVADVSGSMAFRLSGIVTHENSSLFPSVNSVGGYQRWLWDRVTGTNRQKRTNTQVGGRFTHAITPRTYYEIKLNSLFVRTIVGATPVPGSLMDSAIVGSSAINWSSILSGTVRNSPDGIGYQRGYDVFRNEFTRTLTLDGAITSQVTNAHLLNAGIQLNMYLIDVANTLNLRAGSNLNLQRYRATPLEGAFYFQDKMEFEGLIANIGLRWDVWDVGTDYYVDSFVPFGSTDSAGRFNPDGAAKDNTPVIGRIQPRVGISFPVSVNTVFHLNYGSFMQRPSFQYVVSSRTTQFYNRPVIIGNPRLVPQTTNSYDIGVTQGLGEGFTLDISGYYKDVKNLLQQADFETTRETGVVSSYFNLDYADIRGFRLALTKRRGALTGTINYQFSHATGKSATVTAATPLFTRDDAGAVSTDLTNVPIRDIVLDYDRTHNLIVNIGYVTGEHWGPLLLDTHPFANTAVSVQSNYSSGRPYTSADPAKRRLINAQRSPSEVNVNLKVIKRVRGFIGTATVFSLDVLNVLNTKNLNWDYLFASRPSGTNQNLPLQYYEQFPVDHPDNGIRYWYNKGSQSDFAVDQSFLIYGNAPRSFVFGLEIEF